MNVNQPFENGELGATPRRTGRTHGTAIWLLVIAALAIGTYLGTLHNALVFDDQIIILINCKKWQHDGFWQLVRHDYWGEQRFDVLYRPLTTISYVWNYRLSGACPESFRAVNVLLHAACCCALFCLTRAVFRDDRAAGMASVLFAVHALHVEAVAQIVGRAELLAAFFSMLALCLYVMDVQRRGGRPTWRYGVALCASALAMLSKESGTAVVGMMVGYDVWSLRFASRSATPPTLPQADARRARRAWRRILKRLALQRWVGLLLVTLIVLTVRIQVLGRFAQDRGAIDKMDNPIASASPAARVLTPIVLLGRAVRLLIWPHPLCHDYSYNALPLCETVLDARLWWGLLCIVAMVAAGVRSYRRRGYVLGCIALFAISYGLVSNTLVLSGTIFAERLLYMPSVAFCWLVGIGVAAAGRSLSNRLGSARAGWLVVAPLFALLCVIHVFLAERRGREWRDMPSLIAAALRITDQSTRVHMQAGYHADLDNDTSTALHHYERAVEIMPEHAPAQYKLGRALHLAGDDVRAIPHLHEAFGRLPAEANHLAAYYLAEAYRALGQPDEEATWRARAKALRPKGFELEPGLAP